MSLIIALVLTLFPTTPEAEALQSTAPANLTIETARVHLVAARLAAEVYKVDANLLLATAWYESRYTVNAVGPLVRGKRACGVLQPIMEDGCSKTPDLFNGYLVGAKHLRTWIDAARGDMQMALIGYAGGYALIEKCKEGPVMVVRGKRDVDLCTVANVRLARARYIQRTITPRNAS